MSKRIAILTGGGDVPGLNMVIKGFVARMEEAGWEVIGLRRGWAALLNILPDPAADNSDWVVELTRASTRTIDRSGGTVLHTSRINPEIMKPESVPDHLQARAAGAAARGRVDLTAAALEVLEFLRLDALVAVGGDGTLSFANRLHREGIKVIGVPKTMDNDVFGTDYCIGFSTAVTRSVNFINDLRTAAGSHERFLVVELWRTACSPPISPAPTARSSPRSPSSRARWSRCWPRTSAPTPATTPWWRFPKAPIRWAASARRAAKRTRSATASWAGSAASCAARSKPTPASA